MTTLLLWQTNIEGVTDLSAKRSKWLAGQVLSLEMYIHYLEIDNPYRIIFPSMIRAEDAGV